MSEKVASETELVKTLRDKTGAGILACRKALQESSWDVEKAIDVLRKAGADLAAKKSHRTTNAGKIESYVHMGGKMGVLVEINCETDFVAKNEVFQQFAKDVAMQIAAANPQFVKRDDVPQEVIDREKEIYKESVKGKPENVVEKILQGKIDKFYKGICLIEQPFIRDDKKSIQEYLTEVIAKTGENITIKRFARFLLGE